MVCDEHHGHPTAHRSNEGAVLVADPQGGCCNQRVYVKRAANVRKLAVFAKSPRLCYLYGSPPRFYTAKTHRRPASCPLEGPCADQPAARSIQPGEFSPKWCQGVHSVRYRPK